MIEPPMEELTLFAHSANNRCFGCGPANERGMHLNFLRSKDDKVICRTAVSDFYEGPPGYVHGGVIATLLDEAMSKAVRAQGRIAMTRRLEVDYLRPVPSGTMIRIEGHITQSEGRKHWVEALIQNEANKTLATGKGLFIEVVQQ